MSFVAKLHGKTVKFIVAHIRKVGEKMNKAGKANLGGDKNDEIGCACRSSQLDCYINVACETKVSLPIPAATLRKN